MLRICCMVLPCSRRSLPKHTSRYSSLDTMNFRYASALILIIIILHNFKWTFHYRLRVWQWWPHGYQSPAKWLIANRFTRWWGKIIFKRMGNIFWPPDGGSFFVHCLIFDAQHRNTLSFVKQPHHSLSSKTIEYFHFSNAPNILTDDCW
jgi:hypothetical protein